MGAILRIRNPAGVVLVDPSSSITRQLGTINTGLNDGSYADANLAHGKPFICATVADTAGAYALPPTVTVSGNTISWTFNGRSSAYRLAVNITYGIYS